MLLLSATSHSILLHTIFNLNKLSGATTPVGLIPLDHPEKSLADAINDLTTADSEDWELMTQGMYTIRRLATHHTTVLSSRFHDVITLLVKYVSQFMRS